MFERERVAVYLAARALARGNKTSLLLNVAIIALVFTNMILLPSIISGSAELFNQQTIDFQTSDVQVRPVEGDRFITRAGALLETVNRVPGVRRASARYQIGATLSAGNRSVSVPVTAIDPRNEVEVTKIHEHMKDGEFFSGGERGEILIGQYAAGNEDTRKDLFASLGGVTVGERIEVAFANGATREYVVKGIYETRSYLVDYSAFITWDELDSLLGPGVDEATEVLVRADTGADVDEVKTALLEAGVQEEVKTWQEAITSAVEESLQTFGIITSISTLVSLVIAIVVIFIVITIKAHEPAPADRDPEGDRDPPVHDRPVVPDPGAGDLRPRHPAGPGHGRTSRRLVHAHPLVFPDGELVPHFEAAALVGNAAWLFAVSLVAGFVPAWRITRENIISAMKAA